MTPEESAGKKAFEEHMKSAGYKNAEWKDLTDAVRAYWIEITAFRTKRAQEKARKRGQS